MKMSISINKRFNREKFLWMVAACLVCFSAVKIIVYRSFLWASVPALPFLVYLAVSRPFIFPFGAYVFLLPFDSLLSITGHTSGATLTKMMGILTMIALLLKGSFENRFVRPDKTVFCWTALVLYAVSTFVWALDPERVKAMIPTALGLFAFYLIVSFYGATEKDWSTLKSAILLGGFLAAIFSIYAYYAGDFFAVNSDRATLMLGDRETNPNKLGFSMLMPTAICIELFFAQKRFNLKKIAYVLIFGILLFCVILTGSREIMLGIGLIFMVFIYSSKRKFTVGLLLVFVSLPLVFFMQQFLIERWQGSVSSGGAGRVDIWWVGLKALGSYWITGVGLNNFPVAYTKFVDYGPGFHGFYREAHNLYLNTSVEFGVAGIALLFWGLKRHYLLIRSSHGTDGQGKMMLIALFWAISAASFFGTYFWDKAYWLFWMMVLIYDNLGKVHGHTEDALHSTEKYRYFKSIRKGPVHL